MKTREVAVVVCCTLLLEIFAVQWHKPSDLSGTALHAETTLGRLHVDVRKTSNGPLSLKLGYANATTHSREEIVSLTLHSSSEEV